MQLFSLLYNLFYCTMGRHPFTKRSGTLYPCQAA